VSGILNLFLGLMVWLRDVKNRLNFGFALFSLSTVLLILLDFIFRFQPSLLILRASYACAALVPMAALFWILEICKSNLRSSVLYRYGLLFLPGLIFFILPFINQLIVADIYELTILGYRGKLGPLFGLYALYFISYMVFFITLLYRTQRNSIDSIFVLQIRFILLGITLYGISALTASVILPQFFQIFDYTLLDAPSLIFFVGFTAYAILKLHLFNIKVIATELLVFALSIFIFIRAVVSESVTEQFINAGIFLSIIIVGVFLIRSVIKEVSQREKIETLAKDLEKTNADLESANVRLKELDKLKSEFVSLASHQMRGPITAIKGYASLLIEGMYGKLDDKVKEAVGVIFESSASMAVIVDDFLNLTKIEQGKMSYDFTLVDICSVADEVSKEIRPVVEKKGLKFIYTCHSDGMHNAVADKGKIRQVMMNLIDNAIKYTPKGSVTLEIKKETHEGHLKISIIVSDTGVGLSADAMPKLFQKFARAKNANDANVLGTGLGLYVVRQMVEAHKGTVRVESEGENKGSRFIVEIPGA